MKNTNITTTATTSESLNPNRYQSGCRQASPLSGWAVLALCLLALGALNVQADRSYTVQDKTLVVGTMRPDPRVNDSLHYIRDPSPGVSMTLGNYRENAVYRVSLQNSRDRNWGEVTGIIVQTYDNGDRLYLVFRGTIMNMPINDQGRSISGPHSPTVILGKVTVLVGTGELRYASGQGSSMGMLTQDGTFSQTTDLTLTLSGEKGE
jgi:hypothetical protein